MSTTLLSKNHIQSLKSVVYAQQFFIAMVLLVLVTVCGTVGFVLIE